MDKTVKITQFIEYVREIWRKRGPSKLIIVCHFLNKLLLSLLNIIVLY